MRRTWATLLLVLCFTAIWTWAASSQKKVVATLTDVRGTVEVKARGAKAWAAVKGTQKLYEGDSVRVGKGGRATLLQAGCPPRVLNEAKTVTVSASKKWLGSAGQKCVTAKQHKSLLKVLDSMAKSSRSQGALVRPGNPDAEIVLSPRFENVLDGRPTFVWKDCGQGSRYTLEVFRDETPVWEAKTTETRIAYPSDRAPLKAGGYQWQVYVQTPDGKRDVDSSAFTVLDAATAQKIRAELSDAKTLAPDKSAVNLPLICLYVEHKLYTSAESALQQALTTALDDETLRQLLAHVYSLTGRPQARTVVLQNAQP